MYLSVVVNIDHFYRIPQRFLFTVSLVVQSQYRGERTLFFEFA